MNLRPVWVKNHVNIIRVDFIQLEKNNFFRFSGTLFLNEVTLFLGSYLKTMYNQPIKKNVTEIVLSKKFKIFMKSCK